MRVTQSEDLKTQSVVVQKRKRELKKCRHGFNDVSKFKNAGVEFKNVSKFKNVGMKFRNAGMKFKNAGMEFKNAGMEFKNAGMKFKIVAFCGKYDIIVL